MTNDEVIRLTLETKGQEATDQLSKSLDRLEAEAKDVAHAYELLEGQENAVYIAQAKYQDATRRAAEDSRLDAFALKLKSVAAQEAAASTETLEKATGKLGRTGADTGYAMLQSGRIIQDFAQGGVGGILNNIEGLTMALGLSGGVAGAATAIGVAIAFMGPPVLKFFESLGATTEEIKPLKDRIDSVAKSLEGLTEKTRLTNAETSEYIKLGKRQAELDKESAENKAKLAAMSVQPKGLVPDKPLGERVTEVAAGHQDELATRAGKGILDAMSQRMGELSRKGAAITPGEQDELNRTRTDFFAMKGTEKDVGADLLTKAMNGNTEAVRKLLGALPNSELRDDLVRATASDRTKEDARNAGRQFLDNTLGRAGRAAGDMAKKSRQDAEAHKAETEQELEERKLKEVNTKENEAKEKRRQTVAEQTAREDERINDEANRKAEAAKTKADHETQQRRNHIYNAVTAGPLDDEAGVAYGTAVTQGYGDGMGPVSHQRAVGDLQKDLAPRIARQTGASPEDAKAVAQQVTSEQAGAFNQTAQSLIGMGESAAGAAKDTLTAMRATAQRAMQLSAQLEASRRGMRQIQSNMTSYSESRLP